MLRFIFAFVLTFSATSAAFAQSVCEQLASAVEASAKEISFYAADGIFDNSAPRATNRKLEQNTHASLVQINLALMQANKCTLPRTPISEKTYFDSAFECVMAASRNERSGSPAKQQLPECDRAKWVRSNGAKKEAA